MRYAISMLCVAAMFSCGGCGHSWTCTRPTVHVLLVWDAMSEASRLEFRGVAAWHFDEVCDFKTWNTQAHVQEFPSGKFLPKTVGLPEWCADDIDFLPVYIVWDDHVPGYNGKRKYYLYRYADSVARHLENY